MAALSRRSQYTTNTWPGFVDALATLLMVIIFVLMVFVLAQFYLSKALTGRDEALQKLQGQVSELADLLALERRSNSDLRLNISQLSDELQASVAERDDLNSALQTLSMRAEIAEDKADTLDKALADAFETMTADKETIQAQIKDLAALHTDLQALSALKKDLEAKITELTEQYAVAKQAIEQKDLTLAERQALLEQQKAALAEQAARLAAQEASLSEAEKARLELERQRMTEEEARKRIAAALSEEEKISESARAQVALLNQQMAALREQLGTLSSQLDESERKNAEKDVQITSLGTRLNAALATKVQELSRYRSEFFGRLRELLGNTPGIRVVGDRFVFQSEVLFESGSADIGTPGKLQLAQLADGLRELSDRIPKDINWVLRVDGHTDTVPINNLRFASNWELSSARAISVVKFLIEQGIPANRLVAAGFGENQPLDPQDDEIGRRRNRRIELKLTQR